MRGKLSNITNIRDLDYHKNFTPMLKFIKKYWNIGSAKPKDYKKFLDKGEDQQQQIDYNSFDGFDTGTTGTFNFPHQVSPADTVFSDLHNGQRPYETLLTAVYAYAYQVGAKSQELLYDEEIGKEIKRTIDMYESCDMKVDSSDKLKFLLDSIRNQANFSRIVK